MGTSTADVFAKLRCFTVYQSSLLWYRYPTYKFKHLSFTQRYRLVYKYEYYINAIVLFITHENCLYKLPTRNSTCANYTHEILRLEVRTLFSINCVND